MELIDNINTLLSDGLRRPIRPGAKPRIATYCFSIYSFEALRAELEKVDSLQFIVTSPTFIPHDATDRAKKLARKYFIPKTEGERSVYCTEIAIQIKNKLTQRANAKECAKWIRQKAQFRSNRTKAPMQQFACVSGTLNDTASDALFMPLHGFTTVDQDNQTGDAVSNFNNNGEEATFTQTFIGLFDQIWSDSERIEEVTDRLCDHIDSIYRENAPECIYFQMLYNVFIEFLEDVSGDTLPNSMTGYAKLLRAFSLPTPIGNHNSDWAIAFEQDKVKYVFFIAEIKDSMSSLELDKIEAAKIDCARKFLAKITSEQVEYDVVNSYDQLMGLVT